MSESAARSSGAAGSTSSAGTRDFVSLARDLERLEAVVEGWEPEAQATVRALRSTVEDILVGALKRLIKQVKQDPGGLAALRASLDDEWILAVLQVHGILRAPGSEDSREGSREDKVERALAGVRPMLAGHGGDVELVAVREQEVEVKLLGSCDGCSQSSVTVKLGIETAVREALPEIARVVVREGAAPVREGIREGSELVSADALTRKIESPFAAHAGAGVWEDAGPAEAVPEGRVLAVDLEQVSVLLTRLASGELRAYPNACTHLGMPLDTGAIEAGIQGPELVCRYHGFRYRLDTGECLTAPEVALPRYPVRVEAGRVRVRAQAQAQSQSQSQSQSHGSRP